MISPASYPEQLKTIRTIAKVIRGQHLNHEQRNERLTTLRRLIESFMSSRMSYDDVNVHHSINGYTNLRTLLDLSIWQLEHETHRCVKTRLRMVEETVDFFLSEYETALEEERKKRAFKIRLEEMNRDEVGDASFNVTIMPSENGDIF